MYKGISDAFTKLGILGVVRYIIQRIAGVYYYEEQINTLHFFLNHYHDISSFPKAEGELRDLQECDVLLIQIVDVICKKNDLEYWLDAGNCLGAVRHNGFIPWDDDFDICMMKEDYEKARIVLKKVLNQYGIEAEEKKGDSLGRIGIGYMHEKTGIWIDLFPCEYTTIDPRDEKARIKYEKDCYRWRRKWQKLKKNNDRDWLTNKRRVYIPQICEKKDGKSIIYCPQYCLKPRMWSIPEIFPLKKVEFEGCLFPAPNNTDAYLKQFYGTDYMGFPRSGVEHHHSEKYKISELAKLNGIDMTQVKSYLKEVLDKCRGDEKDY